MHDPYEETGSLFGSIVHAASSVGHAISSVAKKAEHAASSIPVVGTGLHALEQITVGPYQAALNVISGQRIDKAILNNLKSQVKAAKDIAPYVQTVISVVPGVGTGISGAIGAATALASGQPINQAVLAAARGSLPGGPLAAAAFDAAAAVAQGKSLSNVALAAIPLPPAQKEILTQSLQVAKDIAAGKSVSKIVLDRVNANLSKLPSSVQKAVQVGVALGHGANLQKTLVKAGSSVLLGQAKNMNIPGLKNLVSAAEGTTLQGVTKAVGAAQALNNGSPVLTKALQSALNQFNPGTHEHHGFMTAVNVLKNTIGNKAALGLARRSLPSKAAQDAFDIAIGTVSRTVSSVPSLARRPGAFVPELRSIKGKITANQPNLQHAIDSIRRNPSLMMHHPMVLANKFGTSQQVILDALKQVSTVRLLPWRSLSPNAARFIRKWHPQAPMSALTHGTSDTAGLDETGTKYIVEKGDSPWKIAQKLTGNGANWVQLKSLNSKAKPSITQNVWVGEVLNIPASWQKPTARQAPSPVALPSQPAPTAPVAIPSVPAPVSVAPSILQAKSILVAWSKTDGVNQAGVSNYGGSVEDLSTTFGPRDTLELQAFENWDNKTGSAGLPVDGQLTPAALSALQGWAEARAAQAASPTVTSTPGGGQVTTLPEIVITGTPPDSATPQVSTPPLLPPAPATPPVATPAQPATSATVAAANPGGTKMGPALVGAGIGGVLFGLPGAIIGGIAGAAIS